MEVDLYAIAELFNTTESDRVYRLTAGPWFSRDAALLQYAAHWAPDKRPRHERYKVVCLWADLEFRGFE